MTNKIVFENLKHRPMRTLLSVLLIALPVTMILSLVGVSQGMSEDAQKRTRATGADIVIHGSQAASAVTYSGAPLSEGYLRKLAEQPHVTMAVGVIVHPLEFPLSMMGIDQAQFDAMSGGFTYLEGGPLRPGQAFDMLLDKPYADQQKVHAGDTIHRVGHDWHVIGIIAPGKLARVVVPKTTLQDIDAEPGKLSFIYLRLDDPALADAVVAQLTPQFPNERIDTIAFQMSQFAPDNIASVRVFRYVVIGIGVVIGFAVVCLTMYMAVLQRTREIGILKSLGGSKGFFILRIMLTEAAGLAVGGTIIGILLSYGARWAISSFVPASFPMIIVQAWWLKAFLITMAGALLGALYPGVSAARHDPIEALAYE